MSISQILRFEGIRMSYSTGVFIWFKIKIDMRGGLSPSRLYLGVKEISSTLMICVVFSKADTFITFQEFSYL